MAITFTTTHSTASDGTFSSAGATAWDAGHTVGITLATGKLLGRETAGTGAVEELAITDFAKTADPTFTTKITTPEIVQSGATANEIAYYDANKNLKPLPVATYPSLTELSYVKGVTSAIQAQFAAQVPYTGATADVDLGAYDIAATLVNGVSLSASATRLLLNSSTLGSTGSITIGNSASFLHGVAIGYAATGTDYSTNIGKECGGFTGQRQINIGYATGWYEDGTGAMMIDSYAYERGSKAAARAGAILHGVMSETASAQTLNTASAFTATYGMNIPTGQTYKINGVDQFALKANLASPTFTGTITTPELIQSGATANEIAYYDGSKNLKPLPVATYPSLTELSYVKGVTSAIQTQFAAQVPYTGATANVDLGAYKIDANKFNGVSITASSTRLAFTGVVGATGCVSFGNSTNVLYGVFLGAGGTGTAYSTNVGNQSGGFTGENQINLGYTAGYNESGAGALLVDGYYRASEALGRAEAILYGVMSATVANQTLTTNAAFTALYGMNIPTGQTYKINGVDQFALKANLANPTFTGTVTSPALILSSETASTIASFDGSKNVKSLATSTYPSLTELAYGKGVTSAIQTQIDAKAPLASPTFTGDASFVEVTETVVTPTVTGGAITIDWANGTKQIVVTAANTTITLPAAAAGKGGEIIVQYGGVHTITWAGGTSLKPDGGTAPVATSVNGKYDSYIIVQTASLTFIHDGGRNA